MTQTHKQIYTKTMRTKWAFKKHTHASINQIYELRGRLSKKLKIWTHGDTQRTSNLSQYNTYRRIAKRVTNGYSRRQIGG